MRSRQSKIIIGLASLILLIGLGYQNCGQDFSDQQQEATESNAANNLKVVQTPPSKGDPIPGVEFKRLPDGAATFEITDSRVSVKKADDGKLIFYMNQKAIGSSKCTGSCSGNACSSTSCSYGANPTNACK